MIYFSRHLLFDLFSYRALILRSFLVDNFSSGFVWKLHKLVLLEIWKSLRFMCGKFMPSSKLIPATELDFLLFSKENKFSERFTFSLMCFRVAIRHQSIFFIKKGINQTSRRAIKIKHCSHARNWLGMKASRLCFNWKLKAETRGDIATLLVTPTQTPYPIRLLNKASSGEKFSNYSSQGPRCRRWNRGTDESQFQTIQTILLLEPYI